MTLMKKTLFLIATLFVSLTAGAQTVTDYSVSTDPTFFTANQQVKVTFDLKGFDTPNQWGDVYLWIWLSDPNVGNPSDQGTWSNTADAYKMTDDGNNKYSFTFTPSALWPNIDPTTIKKIGVIAKAKDGSDTGSGERKTTPDYMLNVTAEGVLDIQNSVTSPYIGTAGESLPVSIVTSESADITLSLDNTVLKTVTGTTLDDNVTLPQSGDHWLITKAQAGTKISYDSVFVTIKQDLTGTMPAGYRKGINYVDDTTVGLVLWAPYKNNVYVLGEFDNWQPKAAYQMHKDGDYYWITLNVEKGKEYLYQYLVDDSIKIADPYTEKVSDPWNDQYISSTTYPNLIAYPTGKTTGITSSFQTAQTPYNWQVTNFTPPAADSLVIYELLVRDFDASHSFQGVIDHLDYLQDLNVNVVELMPVNEFEGNSSWGYNPDFYFAPDKYYGPKNDLKKLVDECHKRGMAVVIDLVLNHSYGQSPFVQLYFKDGKPTAQNPWYNQQSNFENPDAQWGYDFNHESPATQQLVDSINSFWMSQYKVDGFRFDFTKGFSNNFKPLATDPWGSKYDADRIRILERMADRIWKRKSDALVIFEHLADNSEETVLADYNKGILLWGNMSGAAQNAAKGNVTNNNADFSGASYTDRSWNKSRLVGYMESHDEQRVAYVAETSGLANDNYNIKDVPTALKRIELNAALFFTIPGPKMFYMFDELGNDKDINVPSRTGEKEPLWSYVDDPNRTDVFQTYAKLFYLKRNYDIFSTTDFTYSLNGVTKWIKLNKNNQHVVVEGNFGLTAADLSVDFPVTGKWYEYFTGDSINLTSNSYMAHLAPGEYRLYSTENFTKDHIVTDVPTVSANDNPLQVWPNPVQNSLNLSADEDMNRVTVYSITGRVLLDKSFPGYGKTSIAIQSDGWPQGTYIVKVITTSGNVETRKVMKY
ncbi:alpha-amylase [Prolixibacter sp. NT017]|nr:alpha-amylase [Prolixibacter sp. NT017]